MNNQLPPGLEDLVESKVKSGNYGFAADVIREALGLLESGIGCSFSKERTTRRRLPQGWSRSGEVKA